ncbi:MAG: hypothetical protein Q8O72_05985 [Bacteroidales bacterium]|nr:hypothetical protein [Bacteroidales bacterium]
MKKNLFLSFIVLAAISLASCSKDAANPAPAIESVTAVNNIVTVTFSEAVYANNDATGNLTTANFTVAVPNVTFTTSVAHVAGEKVATITLDYTSIIPNGTKVTVTTATSIYDDKGEALATGATASADLAPDLGIIGEWISSGSNVSPLLVTYFQVDSIYAKFGEDNTLLVHQFNIGNTSGTPDVIYQSTFTMEKSGVGNIWNIVIVQEMPYLADVSGIFEIKADPELLWYEVVQTSGTQNVPPTAAAGFGSTNGGVFGDTNIQKFVRK